jgi:hypothetical protein
MRCACWIHKATDTHSEYVTLIALPWQQWLRERASLLRYTYIACLIVCGIIRDKYIELFLSLISTPPAPRWMAGVSFWPVSWRTKFSACLVYDTQWTQPTWKLWRRIRCILHWVSNHNHLTSYFTDWATMTHKRKVCHATPTEPCSLHPFDMGIDFSLLVTMTQN